MPVELDSNSDGSIDASKSFISQANEQTGTTYTLALTDAGKTITLTNGIGITVTVPPHSSVAFATNTVINLAQLGAGQVTVAGGLGVTINSSGSKLKLTGQYSVATLYQTAENTWLLFGDIAS